MQYTIGEIAAIINVNDYNKNLSGLIIKTAEIDSRNIINAETSLFFALKGNPTDGHDFIQELVGKGVKAFVVSESKFFTDRAD